MQNLQSFFKGYVKKQTKTKNYVFLWETDKVFIVFDNFQNLHKNAEKTSLFASKSDKNSLSYEQMKINIFS